MIRYKGYHLVNEKYLHCWKRLDIKRMRCVIQRTAFLLLGYVSCPGFPPEANTARKPSQEASVFVLGFPVSRTLSNESHSLWVLQSVAFGCSSTRWTTVKTYQGKDTVPSILGLRLPSTKGYALEVGVNKKQTSSKKSKVQIWAVSIPDHLGDLPPHCLLGGAGCWEVERGEKNLYESTQTLKLSWFSFGLCLVLLLLLLFWFGFQYRSFLCTLAIQELYL